MVQRMSCAARRSPHPRRTLPAGRGRARVTERCQGHSRNTEAAVAALPDSLSSPKGQAVLRLALVRIATRLLLDSVNTAPGKTINPGCMCLLLGSGGD